MRASVLDDYALMAGTGNKFAVTLLKGGEPSLALRADAVELCSREQLDGVLFVGPGSGGLQPSNLRMTVVNADGSRPEACGNGLRCAAVFAVEHGLTRGPVMRVETDSGCRAVELLPDGTVRAELGRAVVKVFELELAGEARTAFDVDVGNPHGVLFAEPHDTLVLAEVAAAMRSSTRFPAGVNVELVRLIEPGLYDIEVDERGVGPTGACGTGACAVAASIWEGGSSAAGAELRLRFAGGELRVARREDGELLLRGAVEQLVRVDRRAPVQTAKRGMR